MVYLTVMSSESNQSTASKMLREPVNWLAFISASEVRPLPRQFAGLPPEEVILL